MSNVSTFTLPFEGLELSRFLLTLEESLAGLPGVRVAFVEMDAAEDPDAPMAGIELLIPRALVEKLRAPEDPEPPEDEDLLSAEIVLEYDGEETVLGVDLERNALVMPVLVKLIEDVLRRLEVLGDDEDEEDDLDAEDEALDDEDDEEETDDAEDEDAEDEDAEDEDESDGVGEEEEGEGEDPFEALRVVAEGAFGKTVAIDASAFSFEVAWEEPPRKKAVRVRAFTPTVALGEEEGASWARIESDVCPRDALGPEDAVQINAEADFPLCLDGDTYVMSTSFPARVLEADLFLDLALALAEHADLVGIAIEESKRPRS